MVLNKPLGIVVCSLFSIVGLWIFISQIISIVKASESSHWPSITGIIKTSKIEEYSDEEGTSYSFDVTYEYKVNEKIFTGNTIRFGDAGSCSSLRDAQTLLRLKSPVGKEVDVYYSPRNPAESVLKPGIRNRDYYNLFFGCVFFLFPMFLLVVILFARKPDTSKAKENNIQPL